MKFPPIDMRGVQRSGIGIAVAGVLALVAFTCAKEPAGLPDYITGAGGQSGVACASGAAVAVAGAAGAAGDPGPGGAAGGTASPAVPAAVPATPWLHVEGNQIKDPAGHVVVLRGVAFPDLGELELTEGGINAMIDRVTNPSEPSGGCSPGWAARTIRVAVSPPDGQARTPKQYTPGDDYYATILRPTVDYARQRGLYVIIDWHEIDDTTSHQSTTSAFWTEMAPHFATDSNVLFELYNEPINAGSWPSVKADMQVWHDIVRSGAANNLILVGSANWDQNLGEATSDPIIGTNLVFVAHMYPQHWATVPLRIQIANAAAKFPVAITEWGFEAGSNATTGGTISSYGAPFKNFVDELRLSWTAWCASRSWRPTMFNSDFSLRVGDDVMGGFVKDWLYERRDNDQPRAAP